MEAALKEVWILFQLSPGQRGALVIPRRVHLTLQAMLMLKEVDNKSMKVFDA